jgi:hypothetical protein
LRSSSNSRNDNPLFCEHRSISDRGDAKERATETARDKQRMKGHSKCGEQRQSEEDKPGIQHDTSQDAPPPSRPCRLLSIPSSPQLSVALHRQGTSWREPVTAMIDTSRLASTSKPEPHWSHCSRGGVRDELGNEKLTYAKDAYPKSCACQTRLS